MACSLLRVCFLTPETCSVLLCRPANIARHTATLSVRSSVALLGPNTIHFEKNRAGRVEFVRTALSICTFCFKISKHLKTADVATWQRFLPLHMATCGTFLRNKTKALCLSIETSAGSLLSVEIVSKLSSVEPSKSKQFLNMYSQICVFIFTLYPCITLLIHYVHYKIYTY